MKNISKLFIVLSFIILTGYGIASAAPTSRIERTLLPEVDSIYYLGTTTPSVRAWASVITDQLCLAGNCQTNFASSTLLADTNTWSSTGTTTFNGNQHIIGNLQVDGMFYAPVRIVSSGNATINGALTVTGQTTLATSLTGLLKASSGVISAASAGSDYENPLTFGWPLIRATNAISFGGLATSSPISAGSGFLYATGVNTMASIATSSPIQMSITGNAGTVTNGVYTTDTGSVTNTMLAGSITAAKIALAKGNFLVGNDAGTAQATSTIFISSTGSVGIGTTSPVSKLDVSGTQPGISVNDLSQVEGNGLFTISSGIVGTTGLSVAQGRVGVSALETLLTNTTKTTVKALSVEALTGGGVFTGTQLSYFPSSGNSYINNGGNVGIGTTSPGARLHSLSTTEQLRLGYDASNYWSGTVGATGGLTLQGVGVGGNLTLSATAGQSVNVSNPLITTRNTVDTGRLNIGGSKPTLMFSVFSDTAARLGQFDTTGANGAAFALSNSGTDFGYVGSNKWVTTGNIGDFALYGVSDLVLYGGGQSVNKLIMNATGAAVTGGLTTTGNVGIGTTSPATKLDVNGTITQLTVKSCTLGLTTDALGSITGCVASDERLKKNILPLDTSLSTLLKLSPVTYEWRDKDAQIHAGFVAQQVEKVFPQAVVSAGTDTKGVDPNAINALLVKSVQEQQAQIAQLQAEVEVLKTKQTLNACINY